MERNGGKPSPPPAWRDGAVTYLHLLFYIAISGGQIFFNKASPKTRLPRSLPSLLTAGPCLSNPRRRPLVLLVSSGFSP
ncbi:hypothetical protein PR202_gb28880 [Eleusine coracana subsp. coracana]|uniref:Uncharacterized protein n=1 Tax=Eleusine coracana subsp. coracana TaxID=191504 RepID=A0AAV5FY60_ELECO|nr:hypothetical protein PR202_gb28880 [Eleusine coracana subsp. coracana]